ncbi:MAG: protease pro-enzyme activation domain-containing protein [Thermoplasmata archaeon]
MDRGPHRSTVLLLAGIVLVSSLAGLLSVAPGTVATATTGGGAVSLLPASLQAPWSARSGYMATVGPVANVNPLIDENLSVALTLFPRNLGMFSLAAEPGAILSPAQFTAEYSPSPANYTALEQYLVADGLRPIHTDPERLTLTVAGPASAVERAFGTGIVTATENGRRIQYPTSVPTLPTALQAEVAAVSGLSEGFSRFSLNFHSIPMATLGRTAGSTPLQGRTTNLVTPAAIHLIYGLNSLYNISGTPHFAVGQGIALILWGDGYSPSDIATFFSQYYPSSFPQPQIAPVNVDGAPAPNVSATSDPSQAPLELTLDLEWAGSEAPGATLYPVYAPDGPASDQYSPTDQSLEDALNQAIQEPNVHVVSMSFATSDGSDLSFQAAFSTDFARGSAQGITFIAASGDNGGDSNPKGGCNGQVQPEFPAASPLVLAVGGTAPVLSLSITGAITGLASEPAWINSGGGFSTDYAAPSWQTTGESTPSIAPGGHRGIPDVAGPAAFNFLFFNGQPAAGNGTSFAAPTWGGIIAEMDAVRGGTPFGSITPHLYSIANGQLAQTEAIGLASITAGSNCIASAAPGWDPITGWGSPRAGNLYEDLVASYVDVNISTPSNAVAPGTGLIATVTVTNSSSHAPLASVPVNLSLLSPGYTGPCGGTLALVTGNTSANGTVTLALSVPACYLGSHATVTATVTANGLFGVMSTVVSVNLLALSSVLTFLEQFPYNVVAFAGIMIAATAAGWSIGTYRHRRRAGRVPIPGTAPGVPPAPNGPATGSSPPQAPPLTVRTPSVAPPPSMGVTPPVRIPEGEGRAQCSVCQFQFPTALGFCPRCGQYLPAPPDPGGR